MDDETIHNPINGNIATETKLSSNYTSPYSYDHTQTSQSDLIINLHDNENEE